MFLCVRTVTKNSSFTAAQTESYGHITSSRHTTFQRSEKKRPRSFKNCDKFHSQPLKENYLAVVCNGSVADKYEKKTLLCLITADAAILGLSTHCLSAESENFTDFSEL